PVGCLDAIGARVGAGASREMRCQAAASCGLIPEPAECLPAATVSGDSGLDMLRVTLDLLGATSGE
ncbi:MAG: hypothetical protein AAGD38_23245, partial [Acidobacteriota bacterium]